MGDNLVWKEMKNKIIENKLIIIAGLISILVAYLPYLEKDLVIGSDWSFHLIRIETLASALSRGEFPVKFHSDLCYGFGYGVGFFYSNFFLYIPAILINLGFSLEVAYKLFAGLIMVSIFTGMYAAIWAMTKNKYISLCAAIAYILSVNVLESFYQHFALGRSLALIFMPMALCGMYMVLSENKGRILLEIGFIGLIFSHVLSTVLAVVVCVIFLIVLIKEWVSDKEKWKSLLTAVGVVMVITAAYWIPMFEQWIAQTYRAVKPWTYVDENVIRALNLLSENAIGILLVISSIVLGFWILEKGCRREVKIFYFTGMGFFLITAVYDFWHLFRNLFKFLQFPYRLFSVATVLLLIALALWMNCLPIKRMKACVVLILVINIFNAYQYMEPRTHESEDLGYRVLHEEIAGLGAGEEWLPIQTTRDYLVEPNNAYDDAGSMIKGERDGKNFIFSIAEETKYCDVPFVWYKGFEAITDDGTKLSVTQVPETGLVRVNTEGVSSGNRITVWYKGTMIQNIAYFISIISAIIGIIVGIRRFRKVTE